MGKLSVFFSNWDIFIEIISVFAQIYNEIMEMLDSYRSWFQGEGKKLFFKVIELYRPIINLIGKKHCNLGYTSEETILNAWHFPIKIIKCTTIFCVLSSRCLFKTPLCRLMQLLYSRQLTDSAFDPTGNSYCNFKSNTVKSNKKYSMYRQRMSMGQDLYSE